MKTEPAQATAKSKNTKQNRPLFAKPSHKKATSGRRRDLDPCLKLISEAALETLWPTRCCLCDRPGKPLCERCQTRLPYIDALWACSRCGAAFGKLVCTECNHYTLSHKGFDALAIDGCRSCVRATANTLRIVSMYKDKGDRALAAPLSEMLSQALPTAWRDFFLVPIPARPAALKRRGFDHVELITQHLARTTRMHRQNLLVGKDGRDQRTLGASGRAENARGSFGLRNPKDPPKNVVLIDDVMTTGSTLAAAANTLKAAGVHTVVALTFARV